MVWRQLGSGSFGRMLGRSQAAADNRAGLGSETAAALQKEEEEEEAGRM